VPLFGEARTSKLNRLKRILRSSLELKHGSEEGLRVPELELRELENGTRLCQASERSALAPSVVMSKNVAGASRQDCLKTDCVPDSPQPKGPRAPEKTAPCNVPLRSPN
jgi:hypothetical protein